MKYLLHLFVLLSFMACSKTNPIPEETPLQLPHLNKQALEKIDFKGKEIVALKIKEKFYYVRKDGRLLPTVEYDGEADPFSDGLSRVKLNGKYGFFNENLDIILKPIYDFAFPFHKGIAEICMGCKEKEEDGSPMLDGGKWKKINREGLVIE